MSLLLLQLIIAIAMNKTQQEHNEHNNSIINIFFQTRQ